MAFEASTHSTNLNESIQTKRIINDAEYNAIISFILSLRKNYGYTRKITHRSTVVDIMGTGSRELAKDMEEATCHCGNHFRFAYITIGGVSYMIMLRNNKAIDDGSQITMIQPQPDGDIKFISTVPGKRGAARGLTMKTFLASLPEDAEYTAVLVFDDERFENPTAINESAVSYNSSKLTSKDIVEMSKLGEDDYVTIDGVSYSGLRPENLKKEAEIIKYGRKFITFLVPDDGPTMKLVFNIANGKYEVVKA